MLHTQQTPELNFSSISGPERHSLMIEQIAEMMGIDDADVAAAEKFLEESKQQRVSNCGEEIKKVLEKFSCSLNAQVVINKNGVTPQVVIVSA